MYYSLMIDEVNLDLVPWPHVSNLFLIYHGAPIVS